MIGQFEANRPHLRAVAYRMLGSASEADDALQEAWLKVRRADAETVENAGGWLTTVVARVCLDMLRTRTRLREEPLPERISRGLDPEQEAVLADSLSQALLVVLDSLNPAERLAFVLHDMFDVPFDEIGEIVGRSPEAARQLASRARRRVRGAAVPEAGLRRRREVVDAFLAASRAGDFTRLVALLHPDAVTRGGVPPEVRGAREVAAIFAGRAQGAEPALLDGEPGLIWAPRGRLRVAFRFRFSGELVQEIEMISDRHELARLTTAPTP